MNRRGFLTGLTGLIAAPAIIKVAGIMPVKLVEWEPVNIPTDWINASMNNARVWGLLDEFGGYMDPAAFLRELNRLHFGGDRIPEFVR